MDNNPNFGYTSFDNFGWALLSGTRLITTDHWEDLYQMIYSTGGYLYVLYFVVVIITSVCLLALFPSVFLLTLLEAKSQKNQSDQEKNGGMKKSCFVTDFTTIKDDSNTKKEKTTIRIVDVDAVEERKETLPQTGASSKTDDVVTGDKLLKHHPKCQSTKGYTVCCLWSCCPGPRNGVALFIFDPFVELLISAVVVFEVVATGFDHDDMSDSMICLLRWSNYMFTIVCSFEAILKIFVMSPGRYFRNCWNILDIFIVISSVTEIMLTGVQGMSILRCFRVIRIFKLGRLWPTLHQSIGILGKLQYPLWNFSVLLVLTLLIFAHIGMEAFGWYYEEYYGSGGNFPRWNFLDPIHSCMAVFRIFCGEWIEMMWDCMRAYGWSSSIFFVTTLIVGHHFLVYLLLVFLVFAGNSDPRSCPANDDSKTIYSAVYRISRIGNWLKSHFACKVHPKETGEPQKVGECANAQVENQDGAAGDIELDIIQILRERAQQREDAPPRCCPDPIYASSICWNNHSPFCQNVRQLCYIGIQKDWFERIVSVIIIFYSIFLTSEFEELSSREWLRTVRVVVHVVIGFLFLLEMLIRWTGNGMKAYFSNVWCWQDFVAILSFVTDFFLYASGRGTPPFLKALRIIRIFRLIRELYVFKNARVVLNTLLQALPALLNLLVMGSIYWLVFATIFTQMFSGKFYRCVDNEGVPCNSTYVPNYDSCKSRNLSWQNAVFNFDDITGSFLSMFQIACLKGWIPISQDAIDSRPNKFEQPDPEVNLYMFIAFVLFILLGAFCTYSLLVGILVDGYKRQKEMIDSNLKTLSKGETMYYQIKKMIKGRKPTKKCQTPKIGLQRRAYDFVTNDKFDYAAAFLVSLGLIVMALVRYQMSEGCAYYKVFISFYGIFIAVFTLECILKMFALRCDYFTSIWNLLDLLAVILAFVDISIPLVISTAFISPFLLRSFRIPRQFKFLETIRQTVMIAFPRIATVLFLMFLVVFVYAILGLALFIPYDRPNDEECTDDFYFHSFDSTTAQLFESAISLGYEKMIYPMMKDWHRSRLMRLTYIISFSIITFVLLLSTILVIMMEAYQEAHEKVEETSLTENDINKFYLSWQEFDQSGKGYMKHVDLQAFLNGLEKPLKISNPNKYKIGTMDIPLCKNDTVHHNDVLDALVRNSLSEKGFEVGQNFVLEKYIPPSDRSYKPVSSTLWRQRENLCANSIQKWWNFIKSKREQREQE